MTFAKPTRHLLLLTKEPVLGRVKTRLAAEVGDYGARGAAWAFLEDSLRLASSAASRVAAKLVVLHAPDTSGDELSALVRSCAPAALTLPQGAGDLGARLLRAFESFDGPRVAIGSDSPDLPPERIAEAFEALEGSPAVLGPASDGGYYLIGLAPEVCPRFLEDAGISWSAPTTRSDTLAAMRRAGIDSRLLAERSDVDDIDALRDLARRLERAGPTTAPATRRWLAANEGLLRP